MRAVDGGVTVDDTTPPLAPRPRLKLRSRASRTVDACTTAVDTTTPPAAAAAAPRLRLALRSLDGLLTDERILLAGDGVLRCCPSAGPSLQIIVTLPVRLVLRSSRASPLPPALFLLSVVVLVLLNRDMGSESGGGPLEDERSLDTGREEESEEDGGSGESRKKVRPRRRGGAVVEEVEMEMEGRWFVFRAADGEADVVGGVAVLVEKEGRRWWPRAAGEGEPDEENKGGKGGGGSDSCQGATTLLDTGVEGSLIAMPIWLRRRKSVSFSAAAPPSLSQSSQRGSRMGARRDRPTAVWATGGGGGGSAVPRWCCSVGELLVLLLKSYLLLLLREDADWLCLRLNVVREGVMGVPSGKTTASGVRTPTLLLR